LKGLKEYIINFAGLKLGNHEFEYFIDNKFFENFETSEIQESEIKVVLDFLKESNMLTITFNIQGTADFICDRCLEKFSMEIEGRHNLYVKFGHSNEELSDDVIVIPQEEEKIDVSQHIFEYIHLCLPISKTHDVNKNDNNQCSQEGLDQLGEYARGYDVVDNDSDGTDDIDPRWEVLKKLK